MHDSALIQTKDSFEELRADTIIDISFLPRSLKTYTGNPYANWNIPVEVNRNFKPNYCDEKAGFIDKAFMHTFPQDVPAACTYVLCPLSLCTWSPKMQQLVSLRWVPQPPTHSHSDMQFLADDYRGCLIFLPCLWLVHNTTATFLPTPLNHLGGGLPEGKAWASFTYISSAWHIAWPRQTASLGAWVMAARGTHREAFLLQEPSTSPKPAQLAGRPGRDVSTNKLREQGKQGSTNCVEELFLSSHPALTSWRPAAQNEGQS